MRSRQRSRLASTHHAANTMVPIIGAQNRTMKWIIVSGAIQPTALTINHCRTTMATPGHNRRRRSPGAAAAWLGTAAATGDALGMGPAEIGVWLSFIVSLQSLFYTRPIVARDMRAW